MKLRTLSLSLLVLAVALGVAPLAASKPAATQTSTVTVTAKEFKFALSARSVKAGAVTFRIVNKGKLPHDFKIAGKKSRLIRPGGNAFMKVTFRKKGKYRYICTVPGHAGAGMRGVFTIR